MASEFSYWLTEKAEADLEDILAYITFELFKKLYSILSDRSKR